MIFQVRGLNNLLSFIFYHHLHHLSVLGSYLQHISLVIKSEVYTCETCSFLHALHFEQYQSSTIEINITCPFPENQEYNLNKVFLSSTIYRIRNAALFERYFY